MNEPDEIPLREKNTEEIKNIKPMLEEREHEKHVAPLRTFSSDLATAIKSQKGSIIKIAIAEDERRKREEADASPVSKKNIILISLSLIIIILGIATFIGLMWYKNKSATVAPEEVTLPVSIISSEDAIYMNVTNLKPEEIAGKFSEVVKDPAIREGTIKNVIPAEEVGGVKSKLKTSDFLTQIDAHAPSVFKRVLSDDFMLGIYQYKISNPFFVLQGNAHDIMLAGLLEWESDLYGDLAPLLGANPNVDLVWKSVIIQNRDARALLDSNQKPILYYAFLNPTTVIFGTKGETLLEAVRRLGQ